MFCNVESLMMRKITRYISMYCLLRMIYIHMRGGERYFRQLRSVNSG